MRPLNLTFVGLWFWVATHATAAELPEGRIGCRLTPDDHSGYLTVTYVAAHGPAAEGGLKKGDSLIEIDDVSTQNMAESKASVLIDGKIGEAVALTIRHQESAEKRISIVRRSCPDTFLAAAKEGDPVAEYALGTYFVRGPAAERDLVAAADWLRRASEQGYAPAEAYLGYLYEYGVGIPRDAQAAVRWYLAAARQGNAAAESRLASCYYYGYGVEKDETKAFIWSYSAAQQDDPMAEECLAYLYHEGLGVGKSDQESFNWYYRSAERGNASAQTSLGHIYEYGVGIPQDAKAGVGWYRAAARQGYAAAERELASCYLYGYGVEKDETKAFNWSYSAAQQDDPQAEDTLAYLYHEGLGVGQSDQESFNWYYRSAERGNASAQAGLGHIYEYGIGIPVDAQAAVGWYRAAALQGDAYAERRLASCYFYGRGVEKNDQEAFNWYYSAAQQDDASAENFLAYLYREGRGVARSDLDAFNWYCRAAELGSHDAEWGLADMYARGRGVPKDMTKALGWYKKAYLGFPNDEQLQKAVALVSTKVFLEDLRSTRTLDLSLITSAYHRQILLALWPLGVAYVAGAVVLFRFTTRAAAQPPTLPLAIGWIGFFFEGQGVALFALFVLGTTVRADGLFGVMAFFSTLPVILSTCGSGRYRIWKPSEKPWATLLIYGVGGALVMAAVGFAYPKLYAWIAHSPLPPQPSLVLISKAKDASVLVTFLVASLLFPIAEEIVFRSYFFDALRRRFSGSTVVIVTALAFSVMHFQIAYIVPLFCMGFILGWARLKADSLRLPVFLHVLNNGLLLLLAV